MGPAANGNGLSWHRVAMEWHSRANTGNAGAWQSSGTRRNDMQGHGKSSKATRSYGTAANAKQGKSEVKRRLAAETNREATNRNRKRSG